MTDDSKYTVWKTGPLVRVELLSDAVFAIALTLLVLDLKVPEAPSFSELSHGLSEIWPHLAVYCLSFLIIGMQWVDHHTIFSHTDRCNKGIFWINFLFLMCIAFIPFPTALLGRYPTEKVPVLFYSGVIASTSLAKTCLWSYIAFGARLLDTKVPVAAVRRLTILLVSGLGIAIGFACLALFSPRPVLWAWAVFGIVSIAIRTGIRLTSRPVTRPASKEKVLAPAVRS